MIGKSVVEEQSDPEACTLLQTDNQLDLTDLIITELK